MPNDDERKLESRPKSEGAERPKKQTVSKSEHRAGATNVSARLETLSAESKTLHNKHAFEGNDQDRGMGAKEMSRNKKQTDACTSQRRTRSNATRDREEVEVHARTTRARGQRNVNGDECVVVLSDDDQEDRGDGLGQKRTRHENRKQTDATVSQKAKK